MTSLLFVGFVLMTLMSVAISYQPYQQQIPNGDKVPSPCNTSTIWNGVGHQNPMGGGPRNPFGLDFKANNLVWNAALCQKDSDGDGLTNGYELGDPNCTWSTGQTPSRTTNLTHPGICEPLSSMKCMEKNSWLTSCSDMTFNCSAINSPGVKNYTMRFPVSDVPADETTYICNRYLFPNDSIADIIAIEPVIDNTAILHHMLLYACAEEPIDLPNNGPYLCDMGGTSCTSVLSVWAFGLPGQCLNSQMGFRIGPGGFQYAVLQIHWNNPQRRENLTDSSGMRLHYTTQLRPNRGQIVMIGQQNIMIPPGKDDVTIYGNCSGLCPSLLFNDHSIYLTSAFLHMHILGKSGIMKLYRNGQLLTVLDQVDHYDYNSPTQLEFQTPIEMKPGDSISVKCVYNSTGKAATTYWGEGTSDEMCYGFFSYFPLVQGFDYCGQVNTINICTTRALLSYYYGNYNDMVTFSSSDHCDLPTFLKILPVLSDYCYTSCSDSTCVNATSAAMSGCGLNEDARKFASNMKPNEVSLLGTCSLALPPKTCSGDTATRVPGTANGCLRLQKQHFGSTMLIMFVVYFHRSF